MGEALPGLVITGATGFLGRHLLAALKDRYRIFALARRTPKQAGAPVHPNIRWYQVDIADPGPIAKVFRSIHAKGGAELVIHFAAHYDFTGDEHPEYHRTNVEGLRNVLDLCVGLRPRRFFFASSVAACSFPRPGAPLDEQSVPDGEHIYARSKRIGEEMLRRYRDHFASCTVRFGALYSDWCEYAPLFMFIGTWLSRSWKSRVLGGRGQSAIPYLHIRDGVSFFVRLLEREAALCAAETLVASTDHAISHRELFEAATLAHRGRKAKPIFMPRPLARTGMYAMDLMGRLLGERPFERPWMGKYIDLQMHVDASYTRELLGWAPNPRFGILRRMPFLIENFKTDPIEWNRRNLAAMKEARVANHLKIFHVLEAHEETLVEASVSECTSPQAQSRFPSYRRLPADELRWAAQQTTLHLKNAVRTREKAVFRAHCREIAERRFHQGFESSEVVGIIELKLHTCMQVLRADPQTAGLEEALHDNVVMTFRVGIDEVYDTFEELAGHFVPAESLPSA